MPWTHDGVWLHDEAVGHRGSGVRRNADGSVTPLHRVTGEPPDYYFHDVTGNAWPRWRNPLKNVKGANFAYSVPEVAVQMGANARTVRNLIRSGKLPAFRLGNQEVGPFRIKAGDLKRFLRESRVPYGPKTKLRTRNGA